MIRFVLPFVMGISFCALPVFAVSPVAPFPSLQDEGAKSQEEASQRWADDWLTHRLSWNPLESAVIVTVGNQVIDAGTKRTILLERLHRGVGGVPLRYAKEIRWREDGERFLICDGQQLYVLNALDLSLHAYRENVQSAWWEGRNIAMIQSDGAGNSILRQRRRSYRLKGKAVGSEDGKLLLTIHEKPQWRQNFTLYRNARRRKPIRIGRVFQKQGDACGSHWVAKGRHSQEALIFHAEGAFQNRAYLYRFGGRARLFLQDKRAYLRGMPAFPNREKWLGIKVTGDPTQEKVSMFAIQHGKERMLTFVQGEPIALSATGSGKHYAYLEYREKRLRLMIVEGASRASEVSLPNLEARTHR